MPRPHPPEFRRRAVELARERAKPIAEIAFDLGYPLVPASLDGYRRRRRRQEGRFDQR